VPHQDVPDLRMPIKRIVNRHGVSARYSKHNLDASSNQTLHEELSTSHQESPLSHRSRIRRSRDKRITDTVDTKVAKRLKEIAKPFRNGQARQGGLRRQGQTRSAVTGRGNLPGIGQSGGLMEPAGPDGG